MTLQDQLRLVATLSMMIAENEAVIRAVEAQNAELREARAEVLGSIEPAHIIDDLQLVVPL